MVIWSEFYQEKGWEAQWLGTIIFLLFPILLPNAICAMGEREKKAEMRLRSRLGVPGGLFTTGFVVP
jgi:hypothetical protein